MTRFPLAIAVAALLGTAATAQMAPKPAATVAAKTTTKTTTVKTAATQPAPAPAAKPAPAPRAKVAKPAATGRMVTTKTSTGKSITYNCSLAGNAAKKACKG